jgi:hypothetical protein
MAGKFTRFWMGFLPRRIVPILTAPRVVDYCDRHLAIGKAIVGLGKAGLKLRRAGLTIVSSVLKDNKIAYGLKFLRKTPERDGASADPKAN